MRVSTSRKDHYWILACSGTTSDVAPEVLFDVLHALADGARDVILDFTNLDFLGATGIRCLEATSNEIRSFGGHLGIVAPTPHVRRQIKVNGLGKDIPIYYSILEAVSKLDLIDYQPDSWQDKADLLLVWQKDLPVAGGIRTAIKDHPKSPRFRLKPVREFDDAVHVLNNEIVACILVDCGVQIFKTVNIMEFLREESRISAMPLLVVSTDERMEQAQMIIRHGAHEVLRYPMNMSEAVIRIHNAISYFRDHKPYYPPGRVQ